MAVHTMGFDGSGDAVPALHPLRSRAHCLIEECFSKLLILNLPLAVMSCQGFDDKVEVVTELRALARYADVACRRGPSRNLWRYRDYTAFPISFCNELVKLSILRCRERNAWNRSGVSDFGCDPS